MRSKMNEAHAEPIIKCPEIKKRESNNNKKQIK